MSFFLLAKKGPLQGSTFRFDEKPSWTIGSSAEKADIVLGDTPELVVRITKEEEGIVLTRLDDFPLFVNDTPVEQSFLLKEDDILEIGSSLFALMQETSENTSYPEQAFDAIFEEGEELPESFEKPIKEKPESFEEEAEEKEKTHEANAYDTIFEDTNNDYDDLPFNLFHDATLILKVISGPNAGAEIGIEKEHSYVLGKDPKSCDIVFQDLSVSRNHAKLTIDEEGKAQIEDLDSKNGISINGNLIEGPTEITSADFIQIGTTSFLLIDKEAVAETIYSPVSSIETNQKTPEKGQKKEKKQEKEQASETIPTKYLLFAASFFVISITIFLSFFSLFKSSHIETAHVDEKKLVQEAFIGFDGITYSFNPSSSSIFLTGHVLTSIEHEELHHRLENLSFLSSIEDNIVIDERINKSTNDVLVENAGLRGISLFSPKPGQFVARGYLPNEKAAEELFAYLNSVFPYTDRLNYQIVIETNLRSAIAAAIQTNGFSAISLELANGTVVLRGRYAETHERQFMYLLSEIRKMDGVREVKNFAIASGASRARIDISRNYQVTGYSLQNKKNFSVILNGKIVTLGETIDGMVITGIKQNTILLEKEGLKYKIEYSPR